MIGLSRRQSNRRAPAARSPEDQVILDRQSFVSELEQEIQRARRGRRLSVMVAQLGDRGQYDFVDERAGDPLFDRVGELLLDQKRRIDVAGSLGQGRLALILPETGEPGALAVATRLRAAIRGDFTGLATDAHVGFGIVSFGRHGRNANSLLGSAQRAAGTARALDPQRG
jgi:diguanylate cyclase (GGDEF)-like protein